MQTANIKFRWKKGVASCRSCCEINHNEGTPMKSVIFLLLSFGIISVASGGQKFECLSGPQNMLYYSVGQVRLSAQMWSPGSALTDIQLSTSGSSVIGLAGSRAQGHSQGQYLRFDLGVDSWCGYRLGMVPKSFSQPSFQVFVDAHCENAVRSSVLLTCQWVR